MDVRKESIQKKNYTQGRTSKKIVEKSPYHKAPLPMMWIVEQSSFTGRRTSKMGRPLQSVTIKPSGNDVFPRMPVGKLYLVSFGNRAGKGVTVYRDGSRVRCFDIQ